MPASSRADEMLALYNQDFSYSQIGKKFNISKQMVQKVLKNHPDFKPRSPKKSARLREDRATRAVELRDRLVIQLAHLNLPPDEEDELIRISVRLFSRSYLHDMPAPKSFIWLLLRLEKAIASENWEQVKGMVSDIQQAQEYIKSWSHELDLKESLAEGVKKTKDGFWVI